MRRIVLLIMLGISVVSMARNVTVRAVDEPAAVVFRSIVEQTGKNFVYPSELLRDMRVTVDVKNKSLKQTLSIIFKDTDIEYKIKGRNIMLKRKPSTKHEVRKVENKGIPPILPQHFTTEPKLLEELIVVSRLEAPPVKSVEIGAKKLTAPEIAGTPVLFGESDVLKALQMQPGISGGAEGMAEMHVHGGNADENLFMLDNVPLYQANHFAGLFSAFNVDAVRYIDFFKSSIPAKYDGRLSSYLDVRTKNGSQDGHHGSVRLGLSSGAFNLDGPIGGKTTYSVALRRSWFDVLTIPMIAIINSSNNVDKIRFRYAFTDLNGKITHRFSNRATGFASFYFGNDILKTGAKSVDDPDWYENDKYNLHWGNLVARTGFNYRLSSNISAEFTAAYTRFFSSMNEKHHFRENFNSGFEETKSKIKTDNNINDWIFRGDFDWSPNLNHRIRFGGGYTRHSFQPGRSSRNYINGTTEVVTQDSTETYKANEVNLNIEDDFTLTDKIRLNAGFHGTLFNIGGKNDYGFGPRLSISYRPMDNWAFKAAYSRTNQFVHQLCQTYLSLPTDQWVPIMGDIKPQSADKVSAGVYWQSTDGMYAASAEAYYKKMHNLVDYRDEYYLHPPMELWNARLCTGKGTAKGLDLKVEKTSGKFTGHIAYSLAWADRTFPDKNGGHTFPARFDHRHTINLLVNWKVSDKVNINAAWTGHSGNRFTLLTQVWVSPEFDIWSTYPSPLKARINNYQLPFYHRLDLSFIVKNRRGFWNFSLYNAYCNMNTIAIRRKYNDDDMPVFQKVKMLPVIPSISYTWQF